MDVLPLLSNAVRTLTGYFQGYTLVTLVVAAIYNEYIKVENARRVLLSDVLHESVSKKREGCNGQLGMPRA